MIHVQGWAKRMFPGCVICEICEKKFTKNVPQNSATSTGLICGPPVAWMLQEKPDRSSNWQARAGTKFTNLGLSFFPDPSTTGSLNSMVC